MRLKDIFDFFRRNNSAHIAKQRLQILVSHHRNDTEQDFIPQMRQELIEVISKYIKVDASNINVQLQKEGKHSVLELNVTMPDKSADIKAKNAKKHKAVETI